jgi:hypothetical protein
MLRDNYAEYDRNKTRGVPREGEALLHGIVYCGECGHKMVVQYKNGTRYICNYLRQQHGTPQCQFIPANPIDRQAVTAFFQALARRPNKLNACVIARRSPSVSTSSAIPTIVWSPRNSSIVGKRRFEICGKLKRLSIKIRSIL